MNLHDLPLFDSDEDIEEIACRRRREPKKIKTRTNYFEDLDGPEFRQRFRIEKRTFENLLQKIENQIKSPTNRNNALSPLTKLLLTLRFYATGSMLIVVGDFVGVSTSSASIAVKKVTEAIARLSPQFIYFPKSRVTKENQIQRFYEIASFPFVLGAIDCTHIRIQSPGGETAEEFRNRKGYFSWNVQIVCDDGLKTMDIVARWPGRAHDETIFNNSRVKARFESGEMHNSILLGDSGYGVKNYLITPLQNPQTQAESLFNESHIRTRNVVERTFGVWKRRFPILTTGMKISLDGSKAVIVATAVLHNIALNEDQAWLENINLNDNEDMPFQVGYQEENIMDHGRRRGIINNHFANL